MNWLSNLRLGVKLIGGYLLVALIVVAVGIVAYISAQNLNTSSLNLSNQVGEESTLGNMKQSAFQLRGDVYKYLALPAAADRTTTATAINADFTAFEDNLKQFQGSAGLDDAERTILASISSNYTAYKTDVENILKWADAGDDASAQASLRDGAAHQNRQALDDAMVKYDDAIQKTAQTFLGTATSTFRNVTTLLIVISAIGTLLAFGVGMLLTSNINSPLQASVAMIREIAQGRLSGRLELNRRDELGILAKSIDETSERLGSILKDISETANSLSSASTEILAATTQQLSGATEQSAAVSETTTTVDEVKALSEQAVERSQEVVNSSQKAAEISQTGSRAVTETVESMGHIKERVEGIAENIVALSERTQQIGEIITTVNEIATQSNMLALNASVEASRAGEYGKGFAAVAGEVRSLAEQSRQSTVQVRTILQDVQNAINAAVMATEEGTKVVDTGVKLAAQTGEAISALASAIQQSSQTASQVMAGGRQQASGVEQVAVAMQNINQVTQQSLASSRQVEKSAQDLNTLSGKLAELVKQYKI